MRAINDANVQKAYASGSKKRLDDFAKNLVKSRDKVVFDDKALSVVLRYAWNPNQVQSVREYLNRLKDDEGYPFSQSLYRYEGIEKALHLFSEKDYTSFRHNRNYQKALKELIAEFSVYRLKEVVYESDSDIRDTLPKLNTHSGWTYIQTGRKTKGENIEGLFDSLVRAEETARQVGSFSRPILPGSRTQGSGAFSDDGAETGTCKHKTRLVSMYDLILICSELRYAAPFQKVLAKKPFYAGGKDNYEISSIISSMRSWGEAWLSIDYSHFDQSISSWLIEDAFSVIKASFASVDEQLWTAIVHDFIHKDFVTPEGLMHSDKGVPSGSMFTQIIDTLVNVLMIKTYLISHNLEGRMIAMGDDNLLYSLRVIDPEELASYLAKNFGVVVNASKFAKGVKRENPHFLSREWRQDGQYRHPNILLSKLMFPERRRDYFSGEATPELVVYSYILMYGLGMSEVMDVRKFMMDNNFGGWNTSKVIDFTFMPGALAYSSRYLGAAVVSHYAA